MDDFTKQDMQDALQAITAMIGRSEKAQAKFAQGTSQHALQKNRISALYVALSLIQQALSENAATDPLRKADLERAVAPITSLISKSEKAQQKLAQGTWQHTMLGDYLKALYIALPLLEKGLGEA